nr:MAG TPA: hypothetical protein [Caudoviricetes sp.]
MFKTIAIAVAAGDLIIGAVSVLLFIIVLIIGLFK